MSRRPSARALALVLGVLRDLRAEGGLVGEIARMAVEVGVLPFGDRPADAPAGREIVAAVARRQHGEGGVGNTRGEEAVAAATKLDLGKSGSRTFHHGGEGRGRGHAAVLPSTTSAAVASAVTSSRTASG